MVKTIDYKRGHIFIGGFMSLIPWDSNLSLFNRSGIKKEFKTMQKEMNDFLNSFMSRTGLDVIDDRMRPSFDFAEDRLNDFNPVIDIQDKDDKYVLSVEVPGMSEKDLSVELRKNVLTIMGEKKKEIEEKNKGSTYIESQYGSFRRDIPFEDMLDQDHVKAELKNGVLNIELIKKEKSKSETKRIAITH